MELVLNPSLHTSLLVLASILLIYSILVKDGYAHLVALGLVIIEMLRYVLIYPSERLHMSIDLVIVGLIGISCLISRYRTIQFILAISGFAVLFAHHSKDFLPTLTCGGAIYQSTMQVDSDLELMIQFDNQASLNTWISTDGVDYEVTYPLFKPQDKEFSLDEFIGIDLTSHQNIYEVIEELNQYPQIISVELNELVELDQQPSTSDKLVNDSQLDKQWISDSYKLEEYHRLVKARNRSFSKMKTQQQTIIAILDTGVDGNHEDLKGNYVSTATRYDKDIKGHGTHCAGVAAAVTGNKLGIASLLPSDSPVKVTGIKVLSNRGVGSQKMIIDGILKAADLGYSVISMSLGGLTNEKREQAYIKAVEYAKAKGAIVVAAAGNSGRDAKLHSPANTPGIIAVTAVGPDKKLASFANQVSNLQMGVAAPGVSIHSTIPADKYTSYNGTSMAAPFVSGLIGLMKYYDSNLTTKQIHRLIADNADLVEGVPVVNPLKTLEALFGSLDSVSEE